MAQGLGIAIHALNWKSLGLQKAYEAGILRVLEFHRISSEVSRLVGSTPLEGNLVKS